jgi:hypothetical protein
MKSVKGFLATASVMLLGVSCFDPPAYPVVPEIEFAGIIFRDLPDPEQDSLILSLRFRDGDGDLGIDAANETGPPYNDKFYFRFANGEFLNYFMKRTRTGLPYDTLPDFVKPFNCTNWEVRENPFTRRLDTLYIQLNPNHYNISVEFQIKNNDGSFTPFDFTQVLTYPKCEVQGFNGRFPILFKSNNLQAPLEGTLNYAMTSVAFNVFFSIRTLRLKVFIRDRALHKSNEVITPEFTLQSIKR